MLRIYTSSHNNGAFKTLKATYEFPENNKSPWEQLEWFDVHLDEFKTKEVSVKTFSPYILNYLNLKLAKGQLDYSNLEVEEYYHDDKNDEDSVFDLKILNEGVYLIDARLGSEPIEWIYRQYNEIKDGTQK